MFLVPLPQFYKAPRLDVPTGRWKDGLCDFFNAGFCHPSLWCALCCTQIAVGQAITRLSLTWLGEPGPITRTRQAFLAICLLVGSFYTYSIALELASMPYPLEETPAYMPSLKFIGNFLFTIWAIYSLCRTRETVRARYQIPEQYCSGCEDLCCSFFCGCCVTAQILRHTGNYETHPGACCTSTGHKPGAPINV